MMNFTLAKSVQSIRVVVSFGHGEQFERIVQDSCGGATKTDKILFRRMVRSRAVRPSVRMRTRLRRSIPSVQEISEASRGCCHRMSPMTSAKYWPRFCGTDVSSFQVWAKRRSAVQTAWMSAVRTWRPPSSCAISWQYRYSVRCGGADTATLRGGHADRSE